MRSNLNHTEFKKRLAELTSKEKDFYFFTPFNLSGTPFCGVFDDSTFNLTRNSVWVHVKGIEIKGEYKQIDSQSTEVIYSVGLSRFTRIFSLVFLCVVFVALNVLLGVHWSKVGLATFVTLNVFLGFGVLWVFGGNWFAKKVVNERFMEEFEIGVEDEWEKLANRRI